MRARLRWALTATAAVGVISIGAIVAPSAFAAPVLPGLPDLGASAPAANWAPAGTAGIHPGVVTETAGGGACTSNFVFTNGNTTFLGQAAHCGGTGQATETNGCTSGTVPLGTPVTIKGSDGRSRTGQLAYSSWIAMQANGATDADLCAYNDFALIELDGADVIDVNPSLPFFGGPRALDTNGMGVGEQVFSYGNSPLRAGVALLSPKVGINAGEVGAGRGHQVYTLTPGIPGDSGSGYLSSGGDAVGLLSTLNLAPLPVSNGVADLSKVLDYLNANSQLGEIQLVPGTQPFNALPLGIPISALATPAGPALPPA